MNVQRQRTCLGEKEVISPGDKEAFHRDGVPNVVTNVFSENALHRKPRCSIQQKFQVTTVLLLVPPARLVPDHSEEGRLGPSSTRFALHKLTSEVSSLLSTHSPSKRRKDGNALKGKDQKGRKSKENKWEMNFAEFRFLQVPHQTRRNQAWLSITFTSTCQVLKGMRYACGRCRRILKEKH